MTKRHKTREEREAWNAYMRAYRAKKALEPRHPPRPTGPTDRQLEILRVYADPKLGGTHKAVAMALGISPSAVHNSLGRLTRKLGVKTPAQAIMKLWVVDDESDPPARLRPRAATPE